MGPDSEADILFFFIVKKELGHELRGIYGKNGSGLLIM